MGIVGLGGIVSILREQWRNRRRVGTITPPFASGGVLTGRPDHVGWLRSCGDDVYMDGHPGPIVGDLVAFLRDRLGTIVGYQIDHVHVYNVVTIRGRIGDRDVAIRFDMRALEHRHIEAAISQLINEQSANRYRRVAHFPQHLPCRAEPDQVVMMGVDGGSTICFGSDQRAERRAFRLLKRCLTRAQLDQLIKYNYFEVRGHYTNNRYRINKGTIGNIAQLDPHGNIVATLCVQPVDVFTVGDVMLAQKIGLEGFERELLARANVSHALGHYYDATHEGPEYSEYYEQRVREYQSMDGRIV